MSLWDVVELAWMDCHELLNYLIVSIFGISECERKYVLVCEDAMPADS